MISLVAALLALWPAMARAADDACQGLTADMGPADGGPVFLPSYPAADPGALHQAAFLYDQAVAAIALIGCGEPKQAARIGDAILWAQDHDRFWHDGRLRNAYRAGPVGDGPVKLAGWWDAAKARWLEDRYQAGSDTGNQAWAMLALLALDHAGAGVRFRDGASRLGGWIAGLADSRGAGGFTGGMDGFEPTPIALSWKSTEHNIDVTAAFALMAAATGDPVWRDHAASARAFVDTMWDKDTAAFAAGTAEDGVTRNPILAVDAQLWPLLALPGAAGRYAGALATAQARLGIGGGFTYSEAGQKTGKWTEGTAYAALLARLQGRAEDANALLAGLKALGAPDGLYLATDAPNLPTGFFLKTDDGLVQRFYDRVPHLGAAAWVALAERGFNPFTAAASLP